MKKYLGFAVLALLIALAVVASRPQPTEVELSEVNRSALSVVLEEEGETRVRDRFEVSAPVSGRVLRILLEPGDPVIADETVLARFSPASPVLLDARSRAEARAAASAAESALGRARAERTRVASELQFAESEKKRYQRLQAEGVVASEELDRAALAFDTNTEALKAADFAVAAARGELQVAQARLMQGAVNRSQGGSIDLFSPVDGVVLRRLRESEAVVGPGELLIEVGDPQSLEIVADFLSSDAVQMSAGQITTIDGWGGEPLAGSVRRIEPSGFTKISALGVEEQRVNVIVDLEPGQATAGQLGDNFRVEVNVQVWQSDDELTVDNGALFRRGASWAVYQVEGGKAVEREVEIGRRGGRRSQVLDGLEVGDSVIVYPPSGLENGAAVQGSNT